MKALAALLAVPVPLAGAAPPAKAATLSDQAREVLLAVLQPIGADADGMVRQTFAAMGADQDGRVTPGGPKAFRTGFGFLAQVRGKLAPFDAARAAVFRCRDADKTGVLIFQDCRASTPGSFWQVLARMPDGAFVSW